MMPRFYPSARIQAGWNFRKGQVRAAINEIISDEGDEVHEQGDHDRFVFGFEKTFGDPGDVVNGEFSHQDYGNTTLRLSILGAGGDEAITISNSTFINNMAIGGGATQDRVFFNYHHFHNAVVDVNGAEIEVDNELSVAVGGEASFGQVYVDHNHVHNVTHGGVEMPEMGNTTHDFTGDFFVS